MNERLQELAEQAEEWNEDGGKNKYKVNLEKFAELIVQECVQTLLDNSPELFTNEAAEEDWDKGYDRAMRDCVHHIKEHFGVER